MKNAKQDLRGLIAALGQSYLSDSEFNQELTDLVSIAKSDFDSDGTPAKLCVICDEEDGKSKYLILLSDEALQDRYNALHSIGAKFYQDKTRPIAIFMISEAWTSPSTSLPPSKAPDRKEILSVFGCTIDLRSNMASIEIKRNPDQLGEENITLYDDNTKCQTNLLSQFFRGYIEELINITRESN